MTSEQNGLMELTGVSSAAREGSERGLYRKSRNKEKRVRQILAWTAEVSLVFAVGVSSTAMAVEPSATKATGVINEALGSSASNWDTAPHNTYAFTLTDRIFPTLMISRGGGLVAPLPYAPNQIDTSKLLVSDPATGRPMTVEDLLNRRIMNSGLIVMHKGRVVHESYRNGLSRELRHINMSTSKSFTGMLAQIAKQKGCFNEDDLASKYVPELRGKDAWSDVTVRHVWDMREGTKFVEDYEDESSDVRVQDRSMGWRPRGEGDPEGLRAFIAQGVDEKVNPTGTVFNYASIQTEILGLIVQEACGTPLAEFFAQELWSKLGAEHDAGFATDGFGQPIAQGGMSMTLPDFARAAMFVANKGRTFEGNQILEEAFFDDLVTPNQMLKDAFPQQYKLLAQKGNYRSQFWVIDAEQKIFIMVGVYGQLAYFDYQNEFALVAFGSYPIAKDVLLVQSLGTMIGAMQAAVAANTPDARPNLNVFMITGR